MKLPSGVPAADQKPLLVYSKFTTSANGCYIDPAYVYGKSTYDIDFNGSINGLSYDLAGSTPALEIIDAILVTKDGIDEYFDASWNAGANRFEFETKSGSANPDPLEIESVLRIRANDVYGKLITIELPVGVMKNI